jgi:hypothetical protein
MNIYVIVKVNAVSVMLADLPFIPGPLSLSLSLYIYIYIYRKNESYHMNLTNK